MGLQLQGGTGRREIMAAAGEPTGDGRLADSVGVHAGYARGWCNWGRAHAMSPEGFDGETGAKYETACLSPAPLAGRDCGGAWLWVHTATDWCHGKGSARRRLTLQLLGTAPLHRGNLLVTDACCGTPLKTFPTHQAHSSLTHLQDRGTKWYGDCLLCLARPRRPLPAPI